MIVELDGNLIKNSTDLYRTLDKLSVGQSVVLKVMRGEVKVDLDITLDDLKDLAQQMPSGLTQDYPADSNCPRGAVPLPPGAIPPGMDRPMKFPPPDRTWLRPTDAFAPCPERLYAYD